ncbi:phospholipid-translocating P-type ATPase [Cylindrobasidium torrendii FP15055 ss-10]|uniref:Phospholipid-transporting ATPase n=1 Tax=Cylindrobasidium torrendii FP15055 ss-10 TaxID=1314674 RepID=A0A0D7B775_9AGAR|nr:phospholipid-translocating P-type ATPase [Cylindrobasidium torrendii FP15055 ss-10]
MSIVSLAKSRPRPWYKRLPQFSVEDLFSRKRPAGPPRTIFINQSLPPEYRDAKGRVKREHVYTSNQVISSKYTILTFIPRNLLEQFRRVANIFFLVLCILQFFPKFATISPGVVILPLIIILTLTALKDGYEDIKRHQSDRAVNSSVTKVLAGGHPNENAAEAKSKTFVKGIPLLRLRKGKQALTEYDYDQLQYPDIPGQAPHWRNTKWEDLRVGDLVKLSSDDNIPADILICSTSDEENVAYVETKNLDGETNLKSRNAVSELSHIHNAYEAAHASPFFIQADRPENNMYRLNANVSFGEKQASIDLQTVLLRGTVLRNTEWVIGVVLFTGEDTKIVMNSGNTPSKRSKVEREMNPQVLINLALLFFLAAICAVVDSILEHHYYPLDAPWLFADDQSDDNPSINGIVTFVFGILTFQDIVPISLYLSIEVVRTLQSAFIYFDKEIWHEQSDSPTLARSWNLSDDLGQIEYIFSDKTGTLTQNSMVFRQCSIGAKAYLGDDAYAGEDGESNTSVSLKKSEVDTYAVQSRGSGSTLTPPRVKPPTFVFKDRILRADIDAALLEDADPERVAHARALNGFFSVLALCHTVIASTDPQTGEIEYKAQSPDEAALVQAAADMGYVFIGRDKETLSMLTPSSEEPEQYELLNILEFTSARKRMSVVLRRLDGEDERLFLLTKGADNVIFERLRAGADDLKAQTERHLDQFANEGLRTLTLAYKVISAADYEAWSRRYHDATVALDNREEQIEAVSEELEKDLRLLGATAIEDRLQDGVPETIADLKRAGIKIWVATGDKLETAIAIGRSTNLVAQDSNIIAVRGGGDKPVHQQLKDAIHKFFPEIVDAAELAAHSKRFSLARFDTDPAVGGAGNGERPGGFILVIDGPALTQAFAQDDAQQALLQLGTLCEGVICCRVSPLQKALVVRLVKDNLRVMTLAIGDGANDVSMIQAADVGVGISGEEGLQAANSADYAIGQFRFLKKLLLVHGHWSYARNGTLIFNFFYKNVVPMGIKFWFQIYNGWSASFVFDYVYILFWNSLWSVLGVVGIGLFDRILDAKTLMDMPELYHYGREKYWFSMRDFWIYMGDGVVQSVIIYFIIMFGYWSPTSRSDGYDQYLYEWSTTMAIAGVLVVNLFTGMAAAAWTWWLVFAISFGIVLVWGFSFIYSAIPPTSIETVLYGNYYFLAASAYFWLSILLVVFLSLAPRVIAKTIKFNFMPDDLDIVRYVRKNDPYRDFRNDSETHLGIGMTIMKENRGRTRAASIYSRRSSRRSSMRSRSRASRTSSFYEDDISRPGYVMDIRAQSMTDMSTGLVSVDRGFDFATEENGVAIQRIQTNLTERRQSRMPTGDLMAAMESTTAAELSPGKKGKERHVLGSLKGFVKRKTGSRPGTAESSRGAGA